MKSMTGYGYGETTGFGRKFTVEVKTVNHRFCDVALRLPRSLMVMEEQIKRLIQSQITRGRVDCFLNVEKCTKSADTSVKVDKSLAAAYYNAMKELQEELGIDGKIKLKDLTPLPGVFSLEEAAENVTEWWPVIKEAVDTALTGLIDMRAAEGEKLEADLRKRLDRMADYSVKIRSRAPLVVEDYRNRLSARMQEFVGEGDIEPARLAAEAALFAERSDITEETVRLDSHRSQIDACLDADGAIGRKLDFLVQEINREVNTIGSKANDLEINRMVIEIKSEMEKIREQVQNIE